MINVTRGILFLISILSLVACNTEIKNFGISDGTLIPDSLPRENLGEVLDANGHQIKYDLRLLSTEEEKRTGELWFRLDLESEPWKSYSTFTLRISWAASYPTDFVIDLYNAPESSRVKYARILATHSGVYTPPAQRPSESRVPCTIILEPLMFGVLPLSVEPTLIFILAVVFGAAIVTPKVYSVLYRIGQDARKQQVLKSMKRS